MSEKLSLLLSKGKIDKYHYDTYILFEMTDLGREYLKNVLESIVLEETLPGQAERQDGRRSCWRDIKIAVNLVKNILEGVEKHERDSERSNKQQYRKFDFGDAIPDTR
jgi:hypothetical protein